MLLLCSTRVSNNEQLKGIRESLNMLQIRHLSKDCFLMKRQHAHLNMIFLKPKLNFETGHMLICC